MNILSKAPIMFTRKKGIMIFFGALLTAIVTSASRAEILASDAVERNLITKLFTGYDKGVRPSVNHTQPVLVIFGASLTQILALDEKSQILTSNWWLNLQWVDKKLAWEPADFGNLTSIRLPMESVWKPDILLYNNADLDYFHKTLSTNIILGYDGNVTWLTSTMVRSSCEIDVRFFPFDTQHCTLKFASWTYDGNEVDLVAPEEHGDVSNFIPSCEWDLQRITLHRKVSYYSCCPEPYPDITIQVTINRRPNFYVFNYLAPCGGASLLAFLGFLAPGESGEKVTLGITTLLTLTLFLLNIGEVMPPTATTIPFIGAYYATSMGFVALTTAVQVWVLNVHYRGSRGRPVPNWVRRYVLGGTLQNVLFNNDLQNEKEQTYLLSKGLAAETGIIANKFEDAGRALILRKSISELLDFYEEYPNSVAQHIAKRLMFLLNIITDTIDRQEERVEKESIRAGINDDWHKVAVIADKILLYLFLFSLALVTTSLFINLPINTG